jgi:hypothetical protein
MGGHPFLPPYKKGVLYPIQDYKFERKNKILLIWQYILLQLCIGCDLKISLGLVERNVTREINSCLYFIFFHVLSPHVDCPRTQQL